MPPGPRPSPLHYFVFFRLKKMKAQNESPPPVAFQTDQLVVSSHSRSNSTSRPAMADDDAPAIPSSRKNSEKDSSRKKRRRKKQKSSSKSKRIRYDSTDSSLSSDSEHVDERRKKGKKKVRRARSRSRDRLDVSERGKTKERKNKKRKEKKKSGKEKSRIRDASVISYSSSSSSERVKRTRRRRSRSCSTCRSSSSPEGRGGGKSLKNRNFDKKKVIRRHGKHRSLSCSSSGGSSTSSRSRSIERVGKGSRQKRSKVVEKGYDFGGEDGRVEITPDYADFPSSRSNDSFDGVNKREGRVTTEQRFVGERSHAEAEEKGSGSTYARNLEDSYEGNRVQCIHGVDEDVEPSVRLKSIVVVPVDSTKVDDLELTLRQKALENLKKFRSQASSSLKSPTNKKTVLMDTSERREEKIQEDHSREYISGVSKKNLTMSMIDKGGTQDGSSQLVSGGKPSEKPPSPMVNLTTTREGNSGDQVTKHLDISIRPEIASDDMPLRTTREGNSGDQVTKYPDISIRPEIASDNMPLTTTREENGGGQVTKHPDVSIRPQVASDKMPLRPDLVVHKHKDSLRQVQREQVKRNENVSMPSSVGCAILDSGNTKQIHSTISEIKLAQASFSGPSIPDQAAGTNNNNEAKGEPKTESELEKKTMTVMRGGEMVQVSYKVYIPKKSPALARRQLQR